MRKLKILVVDDNEGIRELLETFLSYDGHKVSLATDGFQAQQALLKENGGYDLVITDHRMPKMLGVELVRWIKMNYPEIKVILMTGDGKEVTSVALAAGADQILDKPFDHDQLIKAIVECFPVKVPL